MATCKSCGAELLWGVNKVSGKRIPLSVKSMERRFIASLMDDSVVMTETYLSHFADCPDAVQHRKPKDAPAR